MSMKLIVVVLLLAFLNSCVSNNGSTQETPSEDTHTTGIQAEKIENKSVKTDTIEIADSIIKNGKNYQNARFKYVTVTKVGENSFEIKGKAQIFEASFGWVVEDGHEELQSGFATTDAGAPEWGNFTFTVTATKKRPGSTLHLILFETSAMDGSRQYELPLPLY